MSAYTYEIKRAGGPGLQPGDVVTIRTENRHAGLRAEVTASGGSVGCHTGGDDPCVQYFDPSDLRTLAEALEKLADDLEQ